MITASFGDRICDISASELIDKGYLVQPTIIIKNNTNCLWDGTEYGTVYRTAIVENMFRNMMIVQDAIDYYNQHKNTLILVTQLKHGEIIQNMFDRRLSETDEGHIMGVAEDVRIVVVDIRRIV